jgi:mRNA interferase MazF
MQKTRPCLVVTKDVINQHRRTIVMVPLSNTSPRNFPLHVPLPSIGATSQAVIDQIRAVDKGSLGKRIGTVTAAEMARIEEAIRTVLDLE